MRIARPQHTAGLRPQRFHHAVSERRHFVYNSPRRRKSAQIQCEALATKCQFTVAAVPVGTATHARHGGRFGSKGCAEAPLPELSQMMQLIFQTTLSTSRRHPVLPPSQQKTRDERAVSQHVCCRKATSSCGRRQRKTFAATVPPNWEIARRFVRMEQRLLLGAYPSGVQMANVG